MTRYRLLFSPEFERSFRRLDGSTREAVLRQLEKLVEHPERGKPLRHTFRGLWRLRIGGLRLVYEIEGDTARVHVLDRRENVYR